jgi:hypothetical protein
MQKFRVVLASPPNENASKSPARSQNVNIPKPSSSDLYRSSPYASFKNSNESKISFQFESALAHFHCLLNEALNAWSKQAGRQAFLFTTLLIILLFADG